MQNKQTPSKAWGAHLFGPDITEWYQGYPVTKDEIKDAGGQLCRCQVCESSPSDAYVGPCPFLCGFWVWDNSPWHEQCNTQSIIHHFDGHSGDGKSSSSESEDDHDDDCTCSECGEMRYLERFYSKLDEEQQQEQDDGKSDTTTTGPLEGCPGVRLADGDSDGTSDKGGGEAEAVHP